MEGVLKKASDLMDNQNAYIAASMERKNIGFNLLKEWDEMHRHDLQFQQNFIQTLFERLEFALKQSYARIGAVIGIFNLLKVDEKFIERENFIHKSIHKCLSFHESSLDEINVQNASKKEKKKAKEIKKENDKKMSLDSMERKMNINRGSVDSKGDKSNQIQNYSESLNEFWIARETWLNSSLKFSKFIDDKILKTLLTQDLFSYEKNIKVIYNKLSDMKKMLAKESEKTAEIIKEFIKNFKEGVTSNKEGKRVKKDTYITLSTFLNHVNYIYDLIKENGIFIVQMWDQVQVLDMKRLHNIRESFLLYFSLVNNNSNERYSQLYINSAALFTKFQAHNLVNHTLSIEEVLIDEEINMIKNKLQKDPTDLKDIKEYFFHLNTNADFLQYFIIKTWEMKVQKTMSSQDAQIYITVDDYLTIYETKNKKNDNLVLSLRIETIEIKVLPEKNEFHVTIPSTGFFSRKSTKKFNCYSRDQQSEFMDSVELAKQKYRS